MVHFLITIYDRYLFLCEDTWVKHMWKFMHDSGIEIEDDLENFAYTREDDSTLASATNLAHTAGLITKEEWGRANNCRKYLKVLTVADIASGDGKSLHSNILQGSILVDMI